MKSNILELAKKLKALAERGEGGERINAQKMLLDLCAKYGIDPNVFDEVKKNDQIFLADSLTFSLLNHIIWKVAGDDCKIWGHRLKKHGLIACVTDAQQVEIEAYYKILSRAYRNTLKAVESAFILKNGLGVDSSDDEERQPLTAEQRAHYMRVGSLMDGMEATPIHKLLSRGEVQP